MMAEGTIRDPVNYVEAMNRLRKINSETPGKEE
jgi:hypothetical protein